MRVSKASDLGPLVRAARAARGWSQQQAGDAAGVSRRLVNLIESGEHPNAELWRVLAVLGAVGIRLDGSMDDWPAEHVAADAAPLVTSDDFDLDAYLAQFRAEPRKP